jgi:hypothetical protein
MEMPIYQKDPETQAHNPKVITKLLYNFRSHEKIIEFSNKAFYDGDLLAKGLSGYNFLSYNFFWNLILSKNRLISLYRINALGSQLVPLAQQKLSHYFPPVLQRQLSGEGEPQPVQLERDRHHRKIHRHHADVRYQSTCHQTGRHWGHLTISPPMSEDVDAFWRQQVARH